MQALDFDTVHEAFYKKLPSGSFWVGKEVVV